jgi:TIR domain
MPTTFISYRRDDAAGYAGRLHETLENRLGRDQVFRDVDTLEPGQDFIDAIESRLAECRVFLAMIGREWLDARDSEGRRRLDQPHDYVRLEIVNALSRRDVRVIPVLIEGASMPPAESLPEEVRALTRKQAVHLRDDAWDHDVDRLAAAITGDSTRKDANVARASLRRWLVACALLVVAAVVVFTLTRGGFGSPGAGLPVAPDTPTDASWASPGGQPYGIALPRLVEIVHTSLVYTLLSASVTPLDKGMKELRLRVRFTNDGRYDANAWDDSFRLVVGSNTFAPTSGLNEIAHGHSSTRGIVTFRVPSGTSKAVLRVTEGGRIAELPLDLSTTTLLVRDEHADAGDALSRRVSANITGAPRLLVRDGDLSVTIERATARRFVNAVRLRFAVRFANTGRYPAGSGDAVVRLAVGDEVRAPIEAPALVIDPNSNAAADVEFEAPPATTRAVLRGTIRSTSGEWPFELRQDTVD